MFGKRYFEPWVGGLYCRPRSQKLLVIGESRYDEKFTDREIIQDVVNSGRRRTFTNFAQAAIGKRHWEPGYAYASENFWNHVVYYNYNTTFFPHKSRKPSSWAERMARQNAHFLGKLLQKFRPTHAVVWGYCNWNSLAVEGAEFTETKPIPDAVSDPYCWITLDEHMTLFARVRHPSSGFSYARWAPMLKAFFVL